MLFRLRIWLLCGLCSIRCVTACLVCVKVLGYYYLLLLDVCGLLGMVLVNCWVVGLVLWVDAVILRL